MKKNDTINKWPKQVAIIGLLAIIVIAGAYLLTLKKPPGCFKFDDGTTQNWTLDQLYDTNSDPYQKLSYAPFSLANHQNIALEATAPNFMITDKNVKSTDIYLVSPDISKDPDWNGVTGYSFDIRREFTSRCYGDFPDLFFTQPQLMVVDNANNAKIHYYAEPVNATSNTMKFHEIRNSNAPYHILYPFTPDMKVDSKVLTSSTGELLMPSDCEVYLRIRIIMTGYIEDGECLYKGTWKIGNVCPIK